MVSKGLVTLEVREPAFRQKGALPEHNLETIMRVTKSQPAFYYNCAPAVLTM